MSWYRKIDIRIHNDFKYRALSDTAKLLWFTLLTFPELTPFGCMRFSEAGMAEHLGWSLKDFQKAFQEVLTKGMVRYDEKAKFLCLPNFIKYNQPENPNVVKSWGKLDGFLPECDLKVMYMHSVKAFVEGIGKGFGEAFPKGLLKGIPKGMANQEQEQEQEQKQDIKNKKPIVDSDESTLSMRPNDLAKLWNEKAPPECKRVALPFKRAKKDLDKIKDALKRNPDPQWWERIVLLLHNLPFVRGHNKRGWKITIDVLVRDAELILDGKYEGTYGKGPEGGGRPQPPRDPDFEGLPEQ
jgi:hypothetical protein